MRNIKIIAFLILVSLGINSCTSSQSSPNGKEITQIGQIAKDVTVSEFNDFIKKGEGQLIDVRTPNEFESGNIASSANIDFYSAGFQDQLTKLDKNKPVYLYCRSGRRSGIAMNLMKDMGFMAVYNLDGGIIAWQEQGLPIAQ